MRHDHLPMRVPACRAEAAAEAAAVTAVCAVLALRHLPTAVSQRPHSHAGVVQARQPLRRPGAAATATRPPR
eukprot:COSAG01_NODE_2248_length_8076_cov_919.568384_12_plen_72_part_00